MTMERSEAYRIGFDAGMESREKDLDKYPGQDEESITKQLEYEEGHDDGCYERIRSQGSLRRSQG